MRAVFNAGAPLLKGVVADTYDVALTPVTEIVSSAGTTTATVKDRVVSRTSNTTSDAVYAATVTSPFGDTAVLTNLTPEVATIDAAGKATRVADGRSVLELTSSRGPAFLRRRFEVEVRRNVGASVDTLQPLTGAAGSLRKHLWDSMLAAVAGKTPGPATQNLNAARTVGGTPSATLNPNLWLSGPGIDFSHSSFQKLFPFNGDLVYWEQAQCHLISPRHAIASQHISEYSFPAVTFRRPDGSFQTVASIGWRQFGADCVVHYFDAPVTGITPVKFVPFSYRSKLPDFSDDTNSTGAPNYTVKPQYPIPAVMLAIREGSGASDAPMNTEERRLRLQLVNAVYGDTFGIIRRNMYQAAYPFQTAYASLQPWTAGAREGDSSSMTYLLVNGELCAFGLQTSYSSGPCLPECLDTLASKMNELAASFGDNTVYTPLTADLSGFTSY